MTTIVTRSGKGSPLTHVEVDTNFTNLNTAKLEAGAIALGSAATPSISFTGDTNTGIYSPGADQVAVATNGTQRLTVDTAATTSTLPVVHPLGAVGTPSITFTGDLNTGIYSPTADTLAFVEGGAEAMRIDSGGSLVIGTSQNPTTGGFSRSVICFKQFSDPNSGFAGIHIEASGDQSVLGIGYNGTTNAFEFDTSYRGTGARRAITFKTTGAECARIDTSGNFGIGTTTPDALLTVNGIGAFGDGAVGTPSIANTGDLNTGFWFPAADTIAASTGGSERARIDSSGRLLVGTSTDSGPTALVEVAVGGQNAAQFGRYTSSSIPAYVLLTKSRSDTKGSHTIVQNNDGMGAVSFLGSDGTQFVESVRITAEVDGTPGANDMPGRLVFSTTADGGSSPTERMRINSSGAFKASTGGSYTDATSLYNEFYQYHNSMGLFIRCTNASQTASVLELNGDRTTTNASYSLFDAYNGNISGRFSVRDSGNAVNTNNSYGAISDIKLKENIVDANSQWDDLKALQVRNYNFKEGQTHTQIGLVAQEAELVSPGIVSESPDRDGEGNDLGTVTKSVNYSVLYMKAVKALQEAMERIETLEQRLTAAGID